jgi:hypothetical protein
MNKYSYRYTVGEDTGMSIGTGTSTSIGVCTLGCSDFES